jgi:hypothetical protein
MPSEASTALRSANGSALIRRDQPGDQPQQRRLARPVAPQHADPGLGQPQGQPLKHALSAQRHAGGLKLDAVG